MPISSFLAPSALARAGVCTSTTRPASPYEGQVIYTTDTDLLQIWNGSAWRTLAFGTPTTGTVLQTVTNYYDTQTSSSSSTYADSGLTATITPTSTTSQILVVAHQASNYKTTNNTYMKLRLVRGSTEIALFESYGGFTNNTGDTGFGACSIVYLDSPATTSATTYKTQFLSNNNNAAVYTHTGGAKSTIALMEIAA